MLHSELDAYFTLSNIVELFTKQKIGSKEITNLEENLKPILQKLKDLTSKLKHEYECKLWSEDPTNMNYFTILGGCGVLCYSTYYTAEEISNAQDSISTSLFHQDAWKLLEEATQGASTSSLLVFLSCPLLTAYQQQHYVEELDYLISALFEWQWNGLRRVTIFCRGDSSNVDMEIVDNVYGSKISLVTVGSISKTQAPEKAIKELSLSDRFKCSISSMNDDDIIETQSYLSITLMHEPKMGSMTKNIVRFPGKDGGLASVRVFIRFM